MGEWDVVKEEKIPEEWQVAGETPIGRPVSTITGKPLLTSMEKVGAVGEGAKEFARAMPAAAGDAAATLLAEVLIPIPGSGLLPKAGAYTARLIASALGSGAGEIAGQEMFGEERDWGKVGTEAVLGPAGEVAGSGLKMAGKGLMHLGKEFTTGGRATTEYLRRKIIKDTSERAVKFIKDLAPEEVKRAGAKIGIDDLGVSIKEAFSEGKVIYNAYSDYIDNMARAGMGGQPGKVVLDDTSQHLGDISKNWKDVYEGIESTFGWTKNMKQAKVLKSLIEDESVNPEDLKSMLAMFWRKGKKSDWANLTEAERSAREKLKETIVGDVSRANPAAKGLRELGDKHWGAVANFNQVAKIYRRGVRTMPSGDTYLNPTELANAIYSSRKQILENKNLGEEVWKKMKAEADYYAKMAPNWRPPSAGGIETSARIAAGAVPSMALAFTHPVLIPVVEGFGSASAWALMGGADKKLIKQVAKFAVKPAFKYGVHLGGRQVLMPSH